MTMRAGLLVVLLSSIGCSTSVTVEPEAAETSRQSALKRGLKPG